MAKTRRQIERLKREWLGDPCWDLWEAEGFEAQREELRAYQESALRFLDELWAARRLTGGDLCMGNNSERTRP